MKKTTKITRKLTVLGIIFQIPAFVLIGITMVIPLIWNFVLSFCEWDGNVKFRFVGLDNFITIFRKKAFSVTYVHTIQLALIATVVGIVLGLMLAAMVYRLGKKEGAFYRFVMFSPSVIPMTAVGLIFVFVLSPDMGILNNVLRLFGLENLTHAWLAEPELVIWVLGIVQGWRSSGIIMMLFYTSMLSISESLFEASRLDGCSYGKQLVKIVFPLIKPTFQMSLSMMLIWSFKSYDIVATMTNGGPGSASKIVPLKMIEVGFGNNEFGLAAAVAFLLTVIVIGFLVVARRITRGESYEF